MKFKTLHFPEILISVRDQRNWIEAPKYKYIECT